MSLTNLIAANQNTPFATASVSLCQAAIDTNISDWSELVSFAENSIVDTTILELGI
jgi:hypothetical protein